MCGYAFKDEKIKAIANTAKYVVSGLETISETPIETHNEAVYQISKKLLKDFDIKVDDETLDLIVQVAVSVL